MTERFEGQKSGVRVSPLLSSWYTCTFPSATPRRLHTGDIANEKRAQGELTNEKPECVCVCVCTDSPILLLISLEEGCELALKMTRPPSVWFITGGDRPLCSPASDGLSLGTHAALSPSYGGTIIHHNTS